MHQSINAYQFLDAFVQMGRKDQFSYDGFGILFDYLEQVEDSTGESIELDVIALCCDYNEDKWLDVAENYNIDVAHCEDDDEMRETILDYLNDHTAVCGHNDNIVVYACF